MVCLNQNYETGMCKYRFYNVKDEVTGLIINLHPVLENDEL